MKATFPCLVVTLIASCLTAHGQGTFVFDQQSSTNENPFSNGSGGAIQQIPPPYGQSFTPGLSAVDFIRLNLNDPFPGIGTGATLFINLRTNAINGPVLATTASVSFSDGFTGVAEFDFSNSVSLTPGVVYYFEPVVQSGDQWNIIAGEYNYPGGSAFAGGQPAVASDFWFREGILVPEPSSVWLLLLCGGFFLVRRRSRRV